MNWDVSNGNDFSRMFSECILLKDIKPLENYKSFIKNYTSIVRNKITHEELKSQFEKFDTDFLGTLTKLEFVKAMTPLFPEFDDQDHLLFLRVTNMFDKAGNVTYTKL